ncbi:MAG: hypothetical protein A2Y74_08675 [Actinobacteria bacterium RBG_13_63_9]|jgi:branched-chain amino acid transport system permease protein|nr:MAG: hypothetical protein A2Y74_08675 [Actinobacteria bacterium RBG_13_63_9]
MAKPLARRTTIRAAAVAALICFLAIIPLLFHSRYHLHVLIVVFLNVVWASTYRLVLRTGQLHFGHHAFIALGAYTSAVLMLEFGVPILVSILLAGFAGLVFAILLGYPSLRVKAVYFAIITWGAAEVLRFVFMRVDHPFGGTTGLSGIPRPNDFAIPLLGITVDWQSKGPFYALALTLMLGALLALYRLEYSRFGLIFNAIRERDFLAQSVGINIMRYKVFAFAVCGSLASMAGALYANYVTVVTPFDFSVTLLILLGSYILVGGMTQFAGPILGTCLMIISSELLSGYPFFKMMLYSGLIIAAMLFLPNGLLGLPKSISVAVGRVRSRASPALRGERDA